MLTSESRGAIEVTSGLIEPTHCHEDDSTELHADDTGTEG